METPSSARTVTRSQTLASLSNTRNSTTSKKTEDPDNGHSKSKPKAANQDRSALIDITNDSPIVGLANGSLETPASSTTKQSNRWKRTPGSGEALLRGQVRTLLQRVEEEAVISKFSLQFCGPLHNDFKSSLNSPAGILAPTPANTPQVSAFVTGLESVDAVSKYPIEDQLETSQLISGNFDGKKGESARETEGDLITRSLFLDFSGKSDSSSDCSSVVTDQGTEATVEKSPLTEDDDASIWSIQVNPSTCDEDEEDDEVIADDIEDGEEDYGGEDEADMLLLDELCEGMNKISVGGDTKEAKMRIKGKHIRFEYNSDDELVEEFCAANDDDDYGEVLHLKGLPTPKGKHLRFQDDENN